MAWKWYDITSYKAAVGGEQGSYYGSIQLYGEGFYALLKFHKDGPLPTASDPTNFGQRFYGHLDFQQMSVMVDLLRNESPIRFGWYDENPNLFHLMTGTEPVGEGDGTLVAAEGQLATRIQRTEISSSAMRCLGLFFVYLQGNEKWE